MKMEGWLGKVVTGVMIAGIIAFISMAIKQGWIVSALGGVPRNEFEAFHKEALKNGDSIALSRQGGDGKSVYVSVAGSENKVSYAPHVLGNETFKVERQSSSK